MLLKLNVSKIFLSVFMLLSHSSFSQEADYHGFRCLDFRFEGHDAKIVFPEKPEKNRHWIWRARFWGHEPQTEIALLKKGFHVVFIDAPEYRGNREGVILWNQFYDYITGEYELNKKAVLEGMSRGGLYIYNWGAENTDKVACIYADAPVCDINSWPGGKGKGKGSPAEWKEFLKYYNLNEETAGTFKGIPVYNSRKLAEAGVPVLHVCGAVDESVPIDENTYPLEKVYREAGGIINVIVKEGVGHHPHSLKNPTPIVRFILSHTSPELLDKQDSYESRMSVNFRGDINNSRIKFEKEKKGRVAFLGGSITYNQGWRDKVCDYLRESFPETEFDFINAGIPSLGSTPGSMRFSCDVLSKGTIDLLFVEAAVNDATNRISPDLMVRGMEGIIYQAIRSNPFTDIVMLHFADQDKMADYNNDRHPEVIIQHEKVAGYYSVSSINLAKEVNDRILNGEFTWRDDFKNLHPSPFGQELYFRTIKYFFDTSWKSTVNGKPEKKELPAQLLDPFSFINGHFGSIRDAKTEKGWKLIKNWEPVDGKPGRSGFVNIDILEASQPGAVLKFKFKGNAIGLMVTSGPDAGMLEYSIDGSEFAKADQFTIWSNNLHLPWLIMLEDELHQGRHKLILKNSSDRNPSSTGTACRIHAFALNY